MAFLFGLIGSIVALVGWFGFKSVASVFVGTGLYLLETLLEWKDLNYNAKKLDILIVLLGCIVGLFIKRVPWYICGFLAINFYSFIISIGSVIFLLVVSVDQNTPHVDFVSLLSLIGSVLGIASYYLIFSNGLPVFVFILFTVISIILPAVAKKHRTNHKNKGKWMEIIAIIIGGFNFYCLIFSLTNISIYVGYLGWIGCSILYKVTTTQNRNDRTAQNAPAVAVTERRDENNPSQEHNCNQNECDSNNIDALNSSATIDKKTRKNTVLVCALIVACLVIVALAVALLLQITSNCHTSGTPTEITAGKENNSTPETTISISSASEAASSVLYLEVYDEKLECIGTASGFLVNNNTTLVTNYHVIQDAYSITAWTQDGQSVGLDLLTAYDEIADLAVLKCDDIVGQEPLKLGDSEEVFQGMQVYAVGYPLGLANTLSDGIVSARYVDEYGNDILQTTAAISSGNSGGPLVNENGQVVGVICAFYVDGQNMNIAISSNTLYTLLEQEFTSILLSEWKERPLMPEQQKSENSESESTEEPSNKGKETAEIEANAEQETELLPTSIQLNIESCFVSVDETIELIPTIVPFNATTDIAWSSSDPERISVNNGSVTVHSINGANAVITATTDNGLIAECTIFATQNYQPYQTSSEGLVYEKFPQIFSIENVVTDNQELGFWSESYSEYTKTYFYSYQTITSNKSEELVLKYVDYLLNNGYLLSSYNFDAFLYNLIDPTGEYSIHIRKEDPYYAHTVSVWVWKNE